MGLPGVSRSKVLTVGVAAVRSESSIILSVAGANTGVAARFAPNAKIEVRA